MITITRVNKQVDLFATSSTTVHFIVYDANKKIIKEADIEPENIKRWKATTIRKELLFIINKMITNRENAYLRYESNAPQEKWLTIQELRDSMIRVSKHSDLKKALHFIKDEILYHLDFVSPSEKSRFYKNYKIKIDSLSEFVNTQILMFERAKVLLESSQKV